MTHLGSVTFRSVGRRPVKSCHSGRDQRPRAHVVPFAHGPRTVGVRRRVTRFLLSFRHPFTLESRWNTLSFRLSLNLQRAPRELSPRLEPLSWDVFTAGIEEALWPLTNRGSLFPYLKRNDVLYWSQTSETRLEIVLLKILSRPRTTGVDKREGPGLRTKTDVLPTE